MRFTHLVLLAIASALTAQAAVTLSTDPFFTQGNPLNLAGSSGQGKTDPNNGTFTLNAAGTGTVGFFISPDQSWLSATCSDCPSGNQITAGGSHTIQVVADPSQLDAAADPYQGIVTIYSGTSTVEVYVSFAVNGVDVSVNPSNLTFYFNDSISSQTSQVTVSGPTGITYTASQPWITLPPDTPAVIGGAGKFNVTVNVDKTKLNPQQSYAETVTLSNNDPAGPFDSKKIYVNIPALPFLLSSSSASVSLTADPGAQTPATGSVTLTASGVGSNPLSVTSSAGWLTGSLSANSIAAGGAGVTLSISANPAGLPNGPNKATLTVTPNSPSGAVMITVTLTVGSSLSFNFTHLAFGAGFQSTLTYVNYSSQAVTCTTNFISDGGGALAMPFPEGLLTNRTDRLNPGGTVHVETTASPNADLQDGWAQAQCTGPVKASLLYRLYTNGLAAGEASVNATTAPATEFVTFGETLTGFAWTNPSSSPAVITVTALPSTPGMAVGNATMTLGPNQHTIANLYQLFNTTNFKGSVQVKSTVPIFSLALNAEASPVFSSLPPGDLPDGTVLATLTGNGTPVPGPYPYVYDFAHLTFGSGFQTTLTYVNYSPQAITCQTTFLSDMGGALPVPFAGGSVSSRTDNLGGGATVHVETQAGQNDSLQDGWAQAQCSGPIKASLLYRLYANGVPQGEASVNASTPATEFVTFAQTLTGFAWANPSNTTASITVIALNASGTPLGSARISLPPNQHTIANLYQLFNTTNFSGSVEIKSTVPILTLSLNAEDSPVFSSLPPGDLPDGTPLAGAN